MNNRTSQSLFARVVPAVVLAMVVAGGCTRDQKIEPVAVGEMVEYRDPGIGFAIKYPTGWVLDATVGRVRFYSEADVDKKFLDPTGAYPLGVAIRIDVTKTGDIAGAMAKFKGDLEQAGFQLGQQQNVTISGTEGTRIPYTGNFGGGNILTGHHILVGSDSAMFDLDFAGFGQMYDAHSAVFEAVTASFQLPKPKVKGRDETLPSETFTEYDAKMFSFIYPDNFNFTNAPKGQNELVLELRGYRQDCSVRFDVFAAQGLSVEKVFEQNKGRYKSTGSGKTTIGGESALFISYSPARDVDSRAYFTVKNDKVMRITMNWYKPQSENYIIAYDKLIASIKFK